MKKRTNTKRKVLIMIAVLLAGIITGTAAFGFVYFTQNSDDGDGGIVPKLGETNARLDNRVSFLLIGADKRPGDHTFNADTLILASVDPDTKIISMLSIPRDTRVTLPGSNSFVKINSVVMYRGIPELVNQVSELTGVKLDGYILSNFEGFKSIIDTLDGVNIYVEKDMYYVTGDKVDGVINLKAGDQRLMGPQALQYARYRNDSMADIGRTARQQKVLKAVAKEMLQASTITKLPKLIPQMMKAVETDLNLSDILKLSKVAASFDSSNIVSQTLPGVGLYLDDLSYWEVNRDQAREITKNLLLGITTDKVIDNMVIDLLDPEVKAHITVPGNPRDPNGTKSSGHIDSDNPQQKPNDTAPKDGDEQTDEPSDNPIETGSNTNSGDTSTGNDNNGQGDQQNDSDPVSGQTGTDQSLIDSNYGNNTGSQDQTIKKSSGLQNPSIAITIN